MIHEPKTFLSQPRILATPEFIERNRLLIRPQSEILAEYEKSKGGFFGFSGEVFLDYLDFDAVKNDFKPDYASDVESGAKEWNLITDISITAQDFLDYMNFAWGKAENQRGVSASRSIQKLGAWLFVMNRDDLATLIHDDDLYNPYGAPALIAVCKCMGIEVPDSLVEFAKHRC